MFSASLAAQEEDATSAGAQLEPERPAIASNESEGGVIALEPREIYNLSVAGLSRIAIGNPDVADVTAVSPSEVLVQAKAAGKTTLIIWDRQGRHMWKVEVVDRSSEAVELQLRQLIDELKLPGVQVNRESNKLFLVGEAPRQEDVDRLEQMLAAFPGVTNLVRVSTLPPAEAPTQLPELVKLSVQVLEINRKDLEKLGVKWFESGSLTEPAATDLSTTKALTRFGTSLERSSFKVNFDALVQRNRARILAEPKLVTASGKNASSFIGVEVPILTATTSSTTTDAVSTSIEFRKTGVLLNMTPTVHAADQNPTATESQRAARKITTTIEAELSDIDASVALAIPVGKQTVNVPGFKVRKTNTEVTTASGESIFIAGLLEVQDSNTASQVPALGSIPVVGRLFRSPENTSTQQEIVIIVTPELLAEEGKTAASDKGYAVEQALAVAEITPSIEDPTLRYAMQIQDRIAKAIQYPLHEKDLGMSGQVKLRVHLFRDGTLGRAVIAESSGIDSFDAEALKAAELQSPYPSFPAELTTPDLWLELPVWFRP